MHTHGHGMKTRKGSGTNIISSSIARADAPRELHFAFRFHYALRALFNNKNAAHQRCSLSNDSRCVNCTSACSSGSSLKANIPTSSKRKMDVQRVKRDRERGGGRETGNDETILISERSFR